VRPEAFTEQRPRLIGLAYRMLGSVAAAEDVVQETWLRWSAADGVESPGAWATTVCTRLCLDELKSARHRREERGETWLPEPWVEEAPPEPGVLRESLSMAFLLLLEELSPRERAAFLLREVFEEDYARIAAVLETSEANVRQLVRRARTALDADRPRFDADPVALTALLAAFGAACDQGDLEALEALLAEEVVAMGDGGGRVPASTRAVVGRSKVARFLRGLWQKGRLHFTYELAWVNGCPGAIARLGGRVYSVGLIEVREGKIVGWRSVLDPRKLRHLEARERAG
jgi:RNA polymerase sigma-70 factor (ECF subfamily)